MILNVNVEHFTMMEASLSSPGASCGSPYSDVTSGSPQFSDAFEPVSPDFVCADTLRLDFSLSVPSTSSDSCVEDIIPSSPPKQMIERFYVGVPVSTTMGTESHVQYLISKMEAGTLGLPSRTTSPGSLTPYSDVAQPKKPGKEGCIKRPMNAFMCFAKMERRQLTNAQPTLHNADVSKHLGKVWKECPSELKMLYKDTADWLKDLHMQENPTYKYKPRKRKAVPGSGPSAKAAAPAASPSSSVSSESAGVVPPKPKRARKSPAKPRTAAAGRARKSSGQPRAVPASPPAALSPPADHTLQMYGGDSPVTINAQAPSSADVISYAIDSTLDSHSYGGTDAVTQYLAANYVTDTPRRNPDVVIADSGEDWLLEASREVKPVLQAASASAPAQQQQHQQLPEKQEMAGAAAAVPESWPAQAGTPREFLLEDMASMFSEQSDMSPLFNTPFGDFDLELGDQLVQGSHQLQDALDFDGDLDNFDLFGSGQFI